LVWQNKPQDSHSCTDQKFNYKLFVRRGAGIFPACQVEDTAIPSNEYLPQTSPGQVTVISSHINVDAKKISQKCKRRQNL